MTGRCRGSCPTDLCPDLFVWDLWMPRESAFLLLLKWKADSRGGVAGKKVEVNWHRELRPDFKAPRTRPVGSSALRRCGYFTVRSNLYSLPPGPSENEAILRATPEVCCACALSKRKEPSRSETLR